ncbi:MAG: LptF/LptG family permease [Elusimicrobiota bacterium]|jgi:lipopolysaccharide export system permease protein
MKIRILSRYILEEYLSNLLLGLIIFTFVLLLDRLFELVDLLLNKGVGLSLSFQLLMLLLPSSLTITLPTSCLLATLLTFGRLSENNEITAARASGLAAWSYVRMPLAAAVLASAFLFPFNSYWAPHAHAHFRQLYVRVLQKNPLVRIEEKTFVEVGDYHLYVDKKGRRSPILKGVTIYKTPAEGAPLRIFAERGQASVDSEQGVRFFLEDGRIEEIDPARPDRWTYTGFKTYQLLIPFRNSVQTSERSIEEMDNRELQARINQLHAQRLPSPLFACQIHLRWAMAVTPLLFVGLGIPLAIRVHRGGRSIGFGISLLVLVGYYALLMGGTGMGQRGVWPAWLAVWMGNGIVAGLALGLGWRFVRH